MMPKKKKNAPPVTDTQTEPAEVEPESVEEPQVEVIEPKHKQLTTSQRLDRLEVLLFKLDKQTETAFNEDRVLLNRVLPLLNEYEQAKARMAQMQAQGQSMPNTANLDRFVSIAEKALSGGGDSSPIQEKMNTLFGNWLDKMSDVLINGPPKSAVEKYLEDYNAKKLAKNIAEATE